MYIRKYFIPNIISLSSILTGFIAIVMASYNEIKFAGAMILLGAFFDGLDGKIARALKATNKIGQELDSLADLVTFGVAPGYLLYQGSLYKFGSLGIFISALVPIFAALRLARFNIKPTHSYFEGIPSTWTGISIAILQGYFSLYFSAFFYLWYALVISLLMVSRFHYYKPGKEIVILNSKKSSFLILFIIALSLNYKLTILGIIFWYPASGILFHIIHYFYTEESHNDFEKYTA